MKRPFLTDASLILNKFLVTSPPENEEASKKTFTQCHYLC